MEIFSSSAQVYIATGVTDMRKSFNTLAGLVQGVIAEDPLSGHLFAFCNRNRDRLKVLWWDGTGFCLLAKRLERGRFPWPKVDGQAKSANLTPRELAQLLGWIEDAAPNRSGWYEWKTPRFGKSTSGTCTSAVRS